MIHHLVIPCDFSSELYLSISINIHFGDILISSA